MVASLDESVQKKKEVWGKGKQQLQLEREAITCEKNSSADTKVSEGGGGGAPSDKADIPLQPMVKTMESQAVALATHWGPLCSRDPPTDPERPHVRAGGYPNEASGKPVQEQTPGRTCGPMERGAPPGAGLLAGPLTFQGTHSGAAFS
ncbi:hypothetical protein WISP_117015 [Willisornis vidua]|uniref:Uncharacterized protein n=1 Tax=Willisornis vidua TaxID=1566151 RepID=A0ABQ9CTL2_9PASS|nr:hypothetical protein WISP_117015 [Willisornis vidua]